MTYLGQIILNVAGASGIVIRSPDEHAKRRPRRVSSSLTMLTGLHLSAHHGRGGLKAMPAIVHRADTTRRSGALSLLEG